MAAGNIVAAELSHLFSIARKSLKERGIFETLKQGPEFLKTYVRRSIAWARIESEDGFDRKYGTNTALMLGPVGFGTDSNNLQYASLYRATRPRTFERIIQTMNIRHEDFVFIDYGSGKGRALFLASEFPFKRIIGIEFSPTLHEVAQKNAQIYRSPTQKCHRIELECVDATAYELPKENTVFYFFDPFQLPVMTAVVENIKKSLKECPRKIFIVYLNPNEWMAVEQSGFLEPFAKSAGGPIETGLESPWVIYTNKF
jgi:SAM-dependent methyltransferase